MRADRWNHANDIETGNTVKSPNTAGTLYSLDTRASWNKSIVMLREKLLWIFACISVLIIYEMCMIAGFLPEKLDVLVAMIFWLRPNADQQQTDGSIKAGTYSFCDNSY